MHETLAYLCVTGVYDIFCLFSLSLQSATGGIAVALRPSGVLAVANIAKDAITNQLKNLVIPDPDPINGVNIPSGGISTTADITISGGSFMPTTINFTGITQSSGGKFVVDADLSGKLQFAKWHESDTEDTGKGLPHTSSFNSPNFTITFSSIKMKLDLTVKLNAQNQLNPSIDSSSLTSQSFTYSLPKQTALTGSLYSCVTDQVNSSIKDKIGGMTSSIISKLSAGFNSALSIIPVSGKLTQDITYSFPGTPQGLQFPSDNIGVQYRVLGKVIYKSTTAPGDIGIVPFPAVSTDHDAVFNANNYEFNALFWAFYKEGALHFSFNKTNVPFAEGMNTSYYTGTPLETAYPNRNLIIDVNLTAPPTVMLKANTQGGEADITYTAILTYWVAKVGSETEKDKQVFVVSVTDVDALEGFAVSTNISSFVQLLTFQVTIVKTLTSKLISTTIPNLDLSTFEEMWKFMLHPSYADVLNKAAKAGVPLPSALQGVFKNYEIQINTGYASIAVNFGSKSTYLELVSLHHGVSSQSALSSSSQHSLTNFSF